MKFSYCPTADVDSGGQEPKGELYFKKATSQKALEQNGANESKPRGKLEKLNKTTN